MSFFFNKSETDENLQYDDAAFLHFAISICTVNIMIFLCLLRKDLLTYQRHGITEIGQLNIFKNKVKNHQKIKTRYFTSWAFLTKLLTIIVSVTVAYGCYANLDTNEKMIGFDPYQILGVQFDAPLIKIKKAYRKLALEYHPDRNVNNPQVAAKFIQISKAYECLTDEEAKEKCQKYGNPDGQASFKVGIGLPKVMINRDNQYFVLPITLAIFLLVVPKVFLSWNSKIKARDQIGMDIANYENIFHCFNPKMNTIAMAWVMGCMKQLDGIFPSKNVSQEELNNFKDLLQQTGSVSQGQLATISNESLTRALCFYQYLADQSQNVFIAEIFPELAIKLAFFSSYFAQRGLHGKALYENPKWIINWCGLLPLRCVIDYTRQLFNQKLRIGDVSSIQFLDLTPEEYEIARTHPIQNLQQKLLNSSEEVEKFVGYFPQNNRSYIKKQIECLPALSLDVKCMIGDDEVNQFTIEDFPRIQVTVTKHNKTHGYVTTNNHPCLHEEQFFILYSYASNLIKFDSFKFSNNKQVHKFKFPLRIQEPRQMTFQVRLISYCYVSSMDIAKEHTVTIVNPVNNNKIHFHKQDLELDRKGKDFWQSLVSMDLQNDSDKELSEGSDSDEENEKPRWQQSKKD